MDLGYDVIVTVSGMLLVFLILVLLMLIIVFEGKIFDSMKEKKAPKAAPAPAAKAAEPAPAAKAAPAVQTEPEAPQVEPGIPGEVVAAIAAAIHAMGNGRYTLRAVRRADRGSWGRAGVNDTTAPF